MKEKERIPYSLLPHDREAAFSGLETWARRGGNEQVVEGETDPRHEK